MIKKLLFFCLVVMSIVGLFSYEGYNIAQSNTIFEALLLLAFVLSTKTFNLGSLIIFTISISYLVLSFIFAYFYNGIGITDFLLAYKTFFYLLLLCGFCNKKLIEQQFLTYIFKVVLFAFLLKYMLWHLLANTHRPGLFFENNFELIFLLFTSLAYHFNVKPLDKKEKLLILMIFLLSGSRSGLLALLCVFAIIEQFKLDFKTAIKLGIFSSLLIAVGWVFISRQGGDIDVEAMDRFVFLQGFLYSISEWNWTNYLFGNAPLTALDSSICNRLTYYKSLFSTSKEGVCYSVILHSYWLRTILDHGIIGLGFIICSLWFLLGCSNVNGRYRLAILGVIFINGLSVSSMNSVYIVLGLLIVISSYRSTNSVCSFAK